MKNIQNYKSVVENQKSLGELIEFHLEFLLQDKSKNKQKILEVYHTGKFLMLFGNKMIFDKLNPGSAIEIFSKFERRNPNA